MKHQFKIQGMTCSGCATKIATTLTKNPKVEEVTIDYATNSGVITGEISFNDIVTTAAQLGYKITPDSEETSTQLEKPSIDVSLLFAGILAVVIMILSMGPWEFPYSSEIQMVLSVVFIIFPARIFIKRAWGQIKSLSMSMDTLVSLGMISSWVGSVVMYGQGHHHLYFESAVMIGFFVLIGKFLEERARESSLKDVNQLLAIRSKKVWIVSKANAALQEIDAKNVLLNDVVYLRPGDRLSVDGVLDDQSGSFDESVVTGESLPVVKVNKEEVKSGSVNVGATGVKIQVTKIGKDTYIERIIGIIQEAKFSRPSIQLLADKISAHFVPAIILLSIATGVYWNQIQGKGLEDSIINALTVLVVACPCALGLATPVAWIAGIGRAAKLGVLVKNYDSLETLSKVDTVVFDKTGTLTEGQPVVVKEFWNSKVNKESLRLHMVSGLIHSSHPLSRALSKFIRKDLNLEGLPRATLKSDVPGQGFEVNFNSQTSDIITVLKFGKPNYVLEQSSELKEWASQMASNGSLLAVSDGQQPIALFALEDKIRENVSKEIGWINKQGIKVIIASGDKQESVKDIVNKMSLSVEAYGGLSPNNKLELIQTLRSKGNVVAFVGDGINDGPAIAAANSGIAMASGTDVASIAAGLVLQSEGIGSIRNAIELSKKITKIIKQNIFWAFFYNIISIPLAMSGHMTPMIASAAMAFSSLSVVLNAMRLKR